MSNENAYHTMMSLHSATLGEYLNRARDLVRAFDVQSGGVLYHDADWDEAFMCALGFVIGNLPECLQSTRIQLYARLSDIELYGDLPFVWS